MPSSLEDLLLRRRRHRPKRALDPETNLPIPMNKTQSLQGRLTYVGIQISSIGALGNVLGWHVPTDEVRGMVTWVQAHWDDLMQFAGLATAAYGRLRINWRKA